MYMLRVHASACIRRSSKGLLMMKKSIVNAEHTCMAVVGGLLNDASRVSYVVLRGNDHLCDERMKEGSEFVTQVQHCAFSSRGVHISQRQRCISLPLSDSPLFPKIFQTLWE